MAGKRRWNLWPKRITHELNGVSGLAGVGGTAIGVAGWTVLTGAAAAVLMIGGTVLAGGAIAYAIWKAIPPVLKRPEDLVGKTLEISELENIDPPIVKLAIVGPTRAGKTTLKNRLSFKGKALERTQAATAYIVYVPSSPPRYIAILDGGGENYSQQFRIAEPADCLCVVLDHNGSDTDPVIDTERLQSHAEFLKQIRDHLKEAKSQRKAWIEILINKRDLWERAAPEQKAIFTDYCGKQVEKWQSASFADSVASHPHSNEIGDDTARFMSHVTTTITN